MPAAPLREKSGLPNGVELIDLQPDAARFQEEAIRGLLSSPKAIAPKYFYDSRGSELFERITRLPEYYLTRTETSILEAHTDDLGALLGERWEMLELGSGSSRKTSILLDASHGHGVYMPIDISREQLLAAAGSVAARYPAVHVVAVCADYSKRIPVPRSHAEARRIIFFPGSTIGNLEPVEAGRFLTNIREHLGEGDAAIIGVDLQKTPSVLLAAYNDSAGITARFNLNLLERMNREVGANFDPRRFEHVAVYDIAAGRIEMHLRSRGKQRVRIGETTIDFAAGETIHTENSYKYTREGFGRMASEAGFQITDVWTDASRWFSVWILAPGETGSARGATPAGEITNV